MAITILAQLLREPEATSDGSASIAHDIHTLWIDEEIGENPYIHKTVNVPVAVFQAIAALPENERVGAYIEAIKDHFFDQRFPLVQPNKPGSMSDEDLLAYIQAYNAWLAEFDANNEACVTWTGHVVTFIEELPVFESWGVPINFTFYQD